VAPDIGCRVITARLSEMWEQQVIVENKPGAGGNLGTESVAPADADGYTVLMAAFPHAVNVSLYRSIGYDPVADFQPVTLLSYQPCVMIVPNASPVKSVADFISYAKANRGKISYASAGRGTSPHLCGELFKRMTGIEMTHVSYRTGAQQDLVAGHVDVMFAAASFELLRAGHARGLAVTTAQRIPVAPDLPTMAESGLRGFDVASWWGLFYPSRLRLPWSQDFIPIRWRCSPSPRFRKGCRISVRYKSVPRLRSSAAIFRPRSPDGGRSFATPTFASTVETHLICSKR
jgi:tripartite-type tricarboxylate transporter receptor subunit TctC